MDWKSKAAALCAAWAVACGGAAAGQDARIQDTRPTADAQRMVDWVQRTGDAAGKPFLVVDKKAAQLYVYDAGGRLQATTPVLLGAAPGDDSAPGVGEHAQSGSLPFAERTTPAGRFETQPGRNIHGERIVWFDYDAALAIHRVRPGRSFATRSARLKASAPQERRLSLGCVVVPVAFYTGVIEPLLGSRPGVVYVLPEVKPLQALLEQLSAA